MKLSEQTHDRLATIVAWLVIIGIVAAIVFGVWSWLSPRIAAGNAYRAEVNEQVRVCILETGRDLQTCYFMVTGTVLDRD